VTRSTPQSSRLPAGRWLPLAAAAALGVLAGIVGFTFAYGDGTAYLQNDPTGCTNCHVMQGHFDSWQSSSHHGAAVCNDCHLPPGFTGKWITKADNGLLHSLAFTTGDYPVPIQIKPRNSRRTQQACLHCHADLVHALAPVESSGDVVPCVHCHASAGHALR
jgi:cytochrome c nitrite reductase small subunit